MATEFSPVVLHGSNGKPEGEEIWTCKTCGAAVCNSVLELHANWHESVASGLCRGKKGVL